MVSSEVVALVVGGKAASLVSRVRALSSLVWRVWGLGLLCLWGDWEEVGVDFLRGCCCCSFGMVEGLLLLLPFV